jgi:hypothetical protein
MFPVAKGIAAEPAPQSSAADLSDQALGNNVLADSSTESREITNLEQRLVSRLELAFVSWWSMIKADGKNRPRIAPARDFCVSFRTFVGV